MIKNRTRPYGYKMEGGRTAVDPAEAETIRGIYRRYAEGLSYKAIAEELTAAGIRYMPDKPVWNKNMVARILQNQSYLGTDKYPAIIDTAASQLARQARKPYTHTESADIKALKPLLVCGVCGEPVRRRLKSDGGERWYCAAEPSHVAAALTDETLLRSIAALQRHLAEHPHLAKARGASGKQIDLGIIRLQNNIDLALSQPEIDPAAVQNSILSLAAQKYALCDDAGAGEELAARLRQLDGGLLDLGLLRELTAQIKVVHTGAAALVLKNGQTVQPDTAEKGDRSYE